MRETKVCQNCQKEFTIEPEDFEFYEKIKVPAPTWCPECRLQRRLAFRNERSLYKSECSLCGKSIISMYVPESGLRVYCHDCYYSDKWDATEYAQDYDFSKPFFEQFKELENRVPHLALFQAKNVDSPWVNYETNSKNCYLNIGGAENEDSAYNQYLLRSKDCFDNFWLFYGNNYCYEDILGEHNYQVMNSIFCYSCQDVHFSFDCKNCSNLIGCSNLRNKEYYIFNKKVSKDEYKKFTDEYLNGSYEQREKLKKKSEEFWKTQPQRARFVQRSYKVTGDLIMESRNVSGLGLEKSENIKHGLYILEGKDSYDVTSIWGVDKSYEVLAANKIYQIFFSHTILDHSLEVYYSSYLLTQSQYCFGCASLDKKKYCILNKQYTKEEYFKMVEKIKKHMNEMPYIDRKGRVYKFGEFFPPEISSFSYEDTVANEWFPQTRVEIRNNGWKEKKEKDTGSKYEFSDYEIPDRIDEAGDDILEKVLKCEKSGQAYRIVPMELEFYRRFKIPIPRLAPFERHKNRLAFVTSRYKTVKRKCYKCQREVDSVYSQEEFPKVYCEECYNREVN